MTTTSLIAITLGAACGGAALGYFGGAGKSAPALPAPALSSPAPISAGRIADTPRAFAPPIRPALELAPRSFRDAAEAAATLQTLRDQENPRQQIRDMNELCAALDVAGVKALLAALEQRPINSAFERSLASNLMGRWAELDPRAAADYAGSLKNLRQVSVIDAVMGEWAVSDLAAAKRWALEARVREAHLSGVNAIVGVLAGKNPEAVFAFLEELPATEDKSFYISSLFSRLAKKNVAQAAELATQLASQALRQTAVREVASAWGEKEPGNALAWYLQNTSSQAAEWQSEQMLDKLLKSWTRAAPEEAAAFAGALPPGDRRTTVMGKLGAGWGAVDPEAAANWLQALPKSSESYRAYVSLIESWAKNDPARAGDFILTQPADRSRDWLLDTMGRSWAEADPTAALAWARQHHDPIIERRVAAQALAAMAAKDLPNVDAYLSQLATPGAQTAAIEFVSNQLTRREPGRAAQWVMEMAAKRGVGNAIEWPVTSWTWRDPDAVGTWLNAQAAGAQKDAAVGSYAVALADKNAPGAAQWAATIADETRRRKQVKAVVTKWAEKDRTAARAWVAGTRLAASERQELLQQLDRRKK